MQRLICAFCVSLMTCSVAVFAQDIERKSKTKITVEDGKDITLTGCVTRSPEGGFVLTNAAGKEGALGTYTLVADDGKDLEEHVGHRVEIKGKAVDKGNGKLKIESRSEVDAGAGDKKKRQSKTEVAGDLDGLPFLGVKTVRTLATICP